MENAAKIDLLTSFFNLFEAQVVGLKINGNKITGFVRWEGECEQQNFILNCDYDVLKLQRIKIICDYLYLNRLIDGDKIKIAEVELISRLEKSGYDKIDAINAIDLLCSFSVTMVDSGLETDLFFIHF